ncbi:hypothetical protein [Mucisphaera sp.]|uniref:hypothetical protein n=1 Tax=Mucisphaera sp. TaxID=2913024 RepID=UPI003D0B9D0A
MGEHFSNWQAEQPELIARAAQWIAPMADELTDAFQSVRTRAPLESPRDYYFWAWRQQYWRIVSQATQKQIEVFIDAVVDFLQQRYGDQLNPSHAERFFQEYLITQWEKGSQTHKSLADIIYLRFMFTSRVLVPCLVFFECLPIFLLRSAQKGDLQAMQDLLSLDPSMVGDRFVSQHWYRIMIHGPEVQRELLLQAIQRPPGRKYDRKRMKATIAAILKLIAAKKGHDLTATSLQKMFDALEKDRTGNLMDTDLQDTPDAWRKAIQRQQEMLTAPWQAKSQS